MADILALIQSVVMNHPMQFKNMIQHKMNPKDIVKTIEGFIKTHPVNGTIAVSTGGALIYGKGFGISDQALNTTCDLLTMYNIASVTKQFTAAALLKVLWDANASQKIVSASLNRPLSYYIKSDDPLWDGNMPSWADTITLHHLLTHTSGIKNYTDCEDFWVLYEEKDPPLSKLVALFQNHPLFFKPGTQYRYSNSGYFLIGQVIERLSRKKFSDYLSENFFKPLKMRDTFLPIKGTTPILKKRYSRLARGYEFNLLYPYGPYIELKHYWPHSIDQGDGGIISTASDLLKWNAALYQGQLFPSEIVDMMAEAYVQMPTDSDMDQSFYGYGLEIRENDLGKIYSHSGHIPGYKAYLAYVPSLDLNIVALSNLTFDFSCNQEERKAIKSEVAHIQDVDERQKQYNQRFEKKYPDVIEIMKKHSLIHVNDFREKAQESS
jgi:CubicO group peptidase (beta-lactamase class C family)